MVDQEDPALDPMIQKYGCYFLCILYLCGKQHWLATDINWFRRKLLDNGLPDISDDCTVENPEEVFLCAGISVRQLKNLDGSIALPPSTPCPLGGFEILCYQWQKDAATLYTHFLVGDGNGNIAYDPIQRGSNTAKYGKLVSKRLFALADK